MKIGTHPADTVSRQPTDKGEAGAEGAAEPNTAHCCLNPSGGWLRSDDRAPTPAAAKVRFNYTRRQVKLT